MELIQNESDGIKIEGHRGKWHVLDHSHHEGNKIFLLEHSTYGEEAAALIVFENGSILMDDVWNGFDDLKGEF